MSHLRDYKQHFVMTNWQSNSFPQVESGDKHLKSLTPTPPKKMKQGEYIFFLLFGKSNISFHYAILSIVILNSIQGLVERLNSQRPKEQHNTVHFGQSRLTQCAYYKSLILFDRFLELWVWDDCAASMYLKHSARSLNARPRSRFFHTDRLSSVKKMFIIWQKQE